MISFQLFDSNNDYNQKRSELIIIEMSHPLPRIATITLQMCPTFVFIDIEVLQL